MTDSWKLFVFSVMISVLLPCAASAADIQNFNLAQNSSTSSLDQPQTETKAVTPPAHHKKHHHKPKKGSTKKTAGNHHHKKSATKSASGTSKKTAAARHKAHKKEAHRPTPHVKLASQPKKPANAVAVLGTTAIPAKKVVLADASARKSVLSKSVAYTFCLGYDNCIPTRYEMTGGHYRVMQQTKEGEWVAGKLDPVVSADLGRMAIREPGTTVVRPLTDDEKTRIAEHQGDVHAKLVGDVQSGVTKKEQIKDILRGLQIRNVSELDAYDPKLAGNDVAIEAASELASGR